VRRYRSANTFLAFFALITLVAGLFPSAARPQAIGAPSGPSATSPVIPYRVGIPTPTPAATSTPPTKYVGGKQPQQPQKIIFLLGVGDSKISGQLVSALANRLARYKLADSPLVVPEPAWGVTDFIAQCKADPATEGALVTSVVGTGAGGRDQFIYRRLSIQLAVSTAWIQCIAGDGSHDPTKKIVYYAPCVRDNMRASPEEYVSAHTLDSRCKLPTDFSPSAAPVQADVSYPKYCIRRALLNLSVVYISQKDLNDACTLLGQASSGGQPAIGWVSPIEYSNDTVRPAEPLPPISLLLALTGVYETFVSSKMNSTSMTTIFPTSAPVPHTGEVSGITEMSGSSFNPAAQLGSLTSGIYAQSLNYQNNAFQVPQSEEQSWRAAQGAVSLLVRSMSCARGATPTPGPIWPAYDDTSYPKPISGVTPAPFCSPSPAP
jgi:hypothetical protein